MEVTAYISGIAHPQRREWLRKTIDFMDTQNFPFKRKILTIDQFDGHKITNEEVNYFISRGWRVLVDSHRSRIQSLDRALNEVETEYVFYNEDDVMATMPNPVDLEKVFNTEVDGRACGIISMTLGGTRWGDPKNFLADLKFMNENIILESDDYVIFRRLEEYKNDYFFEFPGLWVRSEIFKGCHQSAKKYGGQIEIGLTRSYINEGYIQKYYKASIAKKGSLEILEEDPSKVNSHCRLLTNLDPHQGNSPFGGGHNY